jgi:flagellar motor switch protein FliN/FliY
MAAEDREQEQGTEVAEVMENDLSLEFAETQNQLRPFTSVPLRISIELGRSRLKISEIMALGFNSVVALGKPVGNNLDIYVNGVLLGRGEVVIFEERVGVKINELVEDND